MKNYIETRVSVIKRYYYKDDADMFKIIDKIEDGDEYCITAEELGFVECEFDHSNEYRIGDLIIYKDNKEITRFED